jgi:hypothetical protein
MNQVIVSAAVRYNGKIYEGSRHPKIMGFIWAMNPYQKITQEDQGFVDNTGKFLSREEAAKVAFEAGQTTRLKSTLFSEDLW